MAIITFDQISRAERQRYGRAIATKSASAVLEEETVSFSATESFTIFLSHSYQDVKLDKDALLGMKAFLEEFNYKVYVDWIIDNKLNREAVTPDTASCLRNRMDNSQCLLFATSANSQNSRWMPWELGYKDGQTGGVNKLGRVAILPILNTAQSSFKGQEYLGIYPYIDAATDAKNNNYQLWVNAANGDYVSFDAWLKGFDPRKHES